MSEASNGLTQEEVRRLIRIVHQLPSTRQDKVAKARAGIQRSEYPVDWQLEAVADRLQEEHDFS